jgi:chromosome segregation ATPase
MTSRSEAIKIKIASLEEAIKDRQFRLRDAEWTLKNVPGEIAQIEDQIVNLRKGDHDR